MAKVPDTTIEGPPVVIALKLLGWGLLVGSFAGFCVVLNAWSNLSDYGVALSVSISALVSAPLVLGFAQGIDKLYKIEEHLRPKSVNDELDGKPEQLAVNSEQSA